MYINWLTFKGCTLLCYENRISESNLKYQFIWRILMKNCYLFCLSTWWEKGRKQEQPGMISVCSVPFNLSSSRQYTFWAGVFWAQKSSGSCSCQQAQRTCGCVLLSFWDVTGAGCLKRHPQQQQHRKTMASPRLQHWKDEAGPRLPSVLRCQVPMRALGSSPYKPGDSPTLIRGTGSRARDLTKGFHWTVWWTMALDLSKGQLPVSWNQGTRVL